MITDSGGATMNTILLADIGTASVGVNVTQDTVVII